MARRPNMRKHPKSGVWYYRKTVPPELRPYLPDPHTGKSELIQSLGHKDKALADREHTRVAEVMERVLDHARLAYVRATTPQEPPRVLSPYEQTLLAMAGEDDFLDLTIDTTKLPPGLRTIPVGSTLVQDVIERERPAQTAKATHTINSVFTAYEREKKLTKTISEEYKRTLLYFCQHSGLTMESDIHAATKAMVRDFNQALIDLPRSTRAKSLKGKTIQELIAYGIAHKKPCISDASRQKHIAAISALFKYAVTKDYRIGDDPTFGITVKVNKARAKRLPYSDEDLKAIFQHPMFNEKKWAHLQWLPILALYTGARLEEIGSLLVEDIKTQDGIVYFAIRETDDDGHFISSVKTAESTRNVPIHPKIVELGFLDYLATIKDGKHTYLFPHLSNKTEGRTATFSNWWRRQRSVFNIHSPKKTFHSFRHSFKDACRRAEIQENIHDELTGHSNGSVGRYYGTGHPLPVLHRNVTKISYPVEIN